jgi:hypothetical protein
MVIGRLARKMISNSSGLQVIVERRTVTLSATLVVFIVASMGFSLEVKQSIPQQFLWM